MEISNNSNILYKILIIVLVIIAITTSIVAVVSINKYSVVEGELEQVKELIKEQQINEKVVKFTSLFIKKVLKAEGEISFDERLELENAVRELDDKEILDQWNRFIKSETSEDAQKEVKNLLEVLINNIII